MDTLVSTFTHTNLPEDEFSHSPGRGGQRVSLPWARDLDVSSIYCMNSGFTNQ